MALFSIDQAFSRNPMGLFLVLAHTEISTLYNEQELNRRYYVKHGDGARELTRSEEITYIPDDEQGQVLISGYWKVTH